MSIQPILDDCGLKIKNDEAVHGGDINSSYCLECSDTKFFLKINSASRFPRMFDKEWEGLNALSLVLSYSKQLNKLTVPRAIKKGIVNQQQYLLLEWIEAGKPNIHFWKIFGEELAGLHHHKQSYFGWEENNYIGSLNQFNSKCNSWHLFYVQNRIIPLVEKLVDTGVFSPRDMADADALCKNVEGVFPEEAPALLHGDLWSGNYKINSFGYASIFDPAVYYGHREMDLGMTRLFGGFDVRFYNAYNEVYPLANDWQKRLPLTQLYPLLVHAILFGGHYISKARNIIKQFV